jgi:hypothetical protein
MESSGLNPSGDQVHLTLHGKRVKRTSQEQINIYVDGGIDEWMHGCTNAWIATGATSSSTYLSLGSDAPSLSSRNLLDDTQVLKGVESVADDTSGGLGVVLSAGGVLSVASSESTAEGPDTDTVASVHAARDLR